METICYLIEKVKIIQTIKTAIIIETKRNIVKLVRKSYKIKTITIISIKTITIKENELTIIETIIERKTNNRTIKSNKLKVTINKIKIKQTLAIITTIPIKYKLTIKTKIRKKKNITADTKIINIKIKNTRV